MLTVIVRVRDFPPEEVFLAGTTGVGFLADTNTATGLGADTVLVEDDTLGD